MKKPTRRRILVSYLDGTSTDLTASEVVAIIARTYGLRHETVERLVADASRTGWVI
jgi:ABC-type Na+ transport system ATPase subunit NatA